MNNNKKSHSTYLCICADCVEMIHDDDDDDGHAVLMNDEVMNCTARP